MLATSSTTLFTGACHVTNSIMYRITSVPTYRVEGGRLKFAVRVIPLQEVDIKEELLEEESFGKKFMVGRFMLTPG